MLWDIEKLALRYLNSHLLEIKLCYNNLFQNSIINELNNTRCLQTRGDMAENAHEFWALGDTKGQTPSYFLFLLPLEKRPNYIISKVNCAWFYKRMYLVNHLGEIYCGYYIGNLFTRSWLDRKGKFGTRDLFT